MHLKSRMLSVCMAGLVSGMSYAGTMGKPISNFEGVFAGVGAGYVNTNLSKWTNITMRSPFSPVTEYYREDNIKETLSPIANVGYFWAWQADWLWGIKGV